MNEPKISIIVPVYNVEEYVGRCLDSIINQTYANLEIIVVDDGSKDGSAKIVDEYAIGDSRVRIIHQSNKGLSAARNTGIKASSGEYLMFIDSDDYIELDSCSRLIAEALDKNCDLVAADGIYKSVDACEKYNKALPYLNFPCLGSEFLTECIKHDQMTMCSVYALYSRKLIVEGNHYFLDGVYHEDELWTPLVYIDAKRVSHLEYCFYYHWYREESITNNNDIINKRVDDTVRICHLLVDELSKYDFPSISVLYDRICMLYMNAVYLGNKTDADIAFISSLAGSRKNKLKVMLYRFSPKLYLRINGFLKNRK